MGKIVVAVQDHVTCMVSDDGVRLGFCIIYKAVVFGDSVDSRLQLLRGDII